ncbi:type II toxin-antitoxin system VapC family toxin [Ginsengibacter hankyongi]|uniref:Type II toxin-antitoxin system VapC family toxin n=1 Tax=Ginsengibacter hankyongi TaxID=2607284 RepID=A0A5J5IBQ6_9BACT|nr:PIN domain-containing protein [Ginsengibacter hankyongi]KAA9036377.1 type II toxin-antitoxin system VapC family toxin [Ginsengibacter hankyongi]
MAIRLLLDTNSIIALLNENAGVIEATNNADDIFISVINELEFKSFSNLSLQDMELFDAFVSMVKVVDLVASNITLKNKIIEIRNTYKLKLPDAIIAASAIINNAILITADKGFKKVEELQLRIIQ